MRTSWLWLPLCALCTIALISARADSVTLKTGEKIAGSIKSETDTEVVIDVAVSSSITDERTYQKSELQKVDKDQPDDIAYRMLGDFAPDPQFSYPLDTYNQILTPLYGFEARYPNSPHIPEVKKRIAAFEAEKTRVVGGQVKYLGEWIASEEASKWEVQIAGFQYYKAMQQQVAAGDYLSALQTFSVLDKSYNSTRSYPAAVALALEVLPAFSTALAARAQAVIADQAQMKRTIASTPEPEKSNLIAEARAEEARNNAAIQQAIAQREKWVPLIPRCALSISTLQKTVAGEYGRLRTIPLTMMNESIAKVDEARAAMSANDFKTADSDLRTASQLWSQNEAARFWAEELKKKMPSPTPRPVATPTPKPTPKPAPKPLPAAAIPNAAAGGAPDPAPGEKSFFSTPLGMGSTGLVILVLAAWGVSAFRGDRQPQE